MPPGTASSFKGNANRKKLCDIVVLMSNLLAVILTVSVEQLDGAAVRFMRREISVYSSNSRKSLFL